MLHTTLSVFATCHNELLLLKRRWCMHHELVCHQKHWLKLPYTNTREVHLKVCVREECFRATMHMLCIWLSCILINYTVCMWGKAGCMEIENKVWHAEFWGKEWKASSHRECNLGLLACVTSSKLWPPENHQASQSSICTTQGVLNIAHPLGSTCRNMAAAYYPIVWRGVISAIIDVHLIE